MECSSRWGSRSAGSFGCGDGVIRATRLIAHHWALPDPARSAAGTWRDRRSLLLVVEDDAGHVGLGEAAPLPGYSQDSFEEAHAALAALLGASLSNRDASAPCGPSLEAASNSVGSLAARAALEAALLDAWARREGVPAWSLLTSGDGPETLPLAVWLPDGTDAALVAARTAHGRGTRAFKVKLDARRGLAEGTATLVALRRAFGNDMTLRADANRSATVAELEPHLPALRDVGLEWLEEPTAEPLSKSLGVPLALDESLVDAALPELAARPDIAALVLKPTALGGIARCLALAAHAETHGRASVASHTLEGPVGFMTAAALGFTVPRPVAQGLGPHGRLLAGSPCPALGGTGDALVRWSAPGFGLTLEQALAGTTVDRTERA